MRAGNELEVIRDHQSQIAALWQEVDRAKKFEVPTQSELDSRYVNVSGDVMTGTLDVLTRVRVLRTDTGSGAAQTWRLEIQNVDATDAIIFGHSSSAYTTGGALAWVGNSQAFMYLPTNGLKIGMGTGATPVTTFGSTGVTVHGHLTVGSVHAGIAAGEARVQALTVSSTSPLAQWYESDGAADEKYWRFIAEGTIFYFQSVNDAYNSTGEVFVVNRTGVTIDSISFSTPIHRAGVQVVNTRRTGWTAASGVATRTTFATGTVTTAQLAERVKALIDDLIAHGLIGA